MTIELLNKESAHYSRHCLHVGIFHDTFITMYIYKNLYYLLVWASFVEIYMRTHPQSYQKQQSIVNECYVLVTVQCESDTLSPTSNQTSKKPFLPTLKPHKPTDAS